MVALGENEISSEKTSTSNINFHTLDNSEINLISSLNSLSMIRELTLRCVNRLLIGNLNINSIGNRFDQLKETVLKHIEILILTETELDETFLGLSSTNMN